MINVNNFTIEGKACPQFELHTVNTTYAFAVLHSGQLEHLHYGKRLKRINFEALSEKHAFQPGNLTDYDVNHRNFSLEDMRLEMSAYGKGDIREPFVEIRYSDGSATSDFVFDSYEVDSSQPDLKTLPGSYYENDTGETETHLKITLKEKCHGIKLILNYYVYEDCDVITRNAVLANDSDETIQVDRLLSLQLDMLGTGYKVRNFTGAWAREMSKNDIVVTAGKLVNSSFTGTSSSRCNPFFIVSEEGADEDFGKCFGFNLVYSGNHYSAVEVSSHRKTRIVSGINPQGFSFVLEPSEVLEAPEAVMTFSDTGYNGMSHHMHDFVREHIVRGKWKKKERPVLLNSWEAAYFNIDEAKLLKLAKAGKDVGIELFVMDDGWFLGRNDDTSSLGDWTVDPKKLSGGLKSLVSKVNALGMYFGIWVEPEMINVKSELYKKHPEWAMDIPGRDHSEGRNERFLDLTNPEVCEYVINAMTEVFSSANIYYVKWDMNRIMSDVFSKYLPANRQGEVFHRYVCGLYSIMKALTEKFPEILFEGCSAGGNRFDLGILSFFPQIWASDDTDAIARLEIEEGYSYGYPMNCVSAHISDCPNHQTLRVTPLETRFNVASFGVLGYECNLCDMSKEELNIIKIQVELYKTLRKTMQYGDFYRQRSGNVYQWTVVSKDKKQAVGTVVQKLVSPNTQTEYYNAAGLEEDKNYHFYGLSKKYNIKEFGNLINTVAPFHVKQDSFMHNMIAKFVTMPGESEDYIIDGSTLNNAGVMLKQAFSGTGYNDNTRHFQDFSSRLYIMDEE